MSCSLTFKQTVLPIKLSGFYFNNNDAEIYIGMQPNNIASLKFWQSEQFDSKSRTSEQLKRTKVLRQKKVWQRHLMNFCLNYHQRHLINFCLNYRQRHLMNFCFNNCQRHFNEILLKIPVNGIYWIFFIFSETSE